MPSELITVILLQSFVDDFSQVTNGNVTQDWLSLKSTDARSSCYKSHQILLLLMIVANI